VCLSPKEMSANLFFVCHQCLQTNCQERFCVFVTKLSGMILFFFTSVSKQIVRKDFVCLSPNKLSEKILSPVPPNKLQGNILFVCHQTNCQEIFCMFVTSFSKQTIRKYFVCLSPVSPNKLSGEILYVCRQCLQTIRKAQSPVQS